MESNDTLWSDTEQDCLLNLSVNYRKAVKTLTASEENCPLKLGLYQSSYALLQHVAERFDKPLEPGVQYISQLGSHRRLFRSVTNLTVTLRKLDLQLKTPTWALYRLWQVCAHILVFASQHQVEAVSGDYLNAFTSLSQFLNEEYYKQQENFMAPVLQLVNCLLLPDTDRERFSLLWQYPNLERCPWSSQSAENDFKMWASNHFLKLAELNNLNLNKNASEVIAATSEFVKTDAVMETEQPLVALQLVRKISEPHIFAASFWQDLLLTSNYKETPQDCFVLMALSELSLNNNSPVTKATVSFHSWLFSRLKEHWNELDVFGLLGHSAKVGFMRLLVVCLTRLTRKALDCESTKLAALILDSLQFVVSESADSKAQSADYSYIVGLLALIHSKEFFDAMFRGKKHRIFNEALSIVRALLKLPSARFRVVHDYAFADWLNAVTAQILFCFDWVHESQGWLTFNDILASIGSGSKELSLTLCCRSKADGLKLLSAEQRLFLAKICWPLNYIALPLVYTEFGKKLAKYADLIAIQQANEAHSLEADLSLDLNSQDSKKRKLSNVEVEYFSNRAQCSIDGDALTTDSLALDMKHVDSQVLYKAVKYYWKGLAACLSNSTAIECLAVKNEDIFAKSLLLQPKEALPSDESLRIILNSAASFPEIISYIVPSNFCNELVEFAQIVSLRKSLVNHVIYPTGKCYSSDSRNTMLFETSLLVNKPNKHEFCSQLVTIFSRLIEAFESESNNGSNLPNALIAAIYADILTMHQLEMSGKGLSLDISGAVLELWTFYGSRDLDRAISNISQLLFASVICSYSVALNPGVYTRNPFKPAFLYIFKTFSTSTENDNHNSVLDSESHLKLPQLFEAMELQTHFRDFAALPDISELKCTTLCFDDGSKVKIPTIFLTSTGHYFNVLLSGSFLESSLSEIALSGIDANVFLAAIAFSARVDRNKNVLFERLATHLDTAIYRTKQEKTPMEFLRFLLDVLDALDKYNMVSLGSSKCFITLLLELLFDADFTTRRSCSRYLMRWFGGKAGLLPDIKSSAIWFKNSDNGRLVFDPTPTNNFQSTLLPLKTVLWWCIMFDLTFWLGDSEFKDFLIKESITAQLFIGEFLDCTYSALRDHCKLASRNHSFMS